MADWIAVATSSRRAEAVLKPLVPGALLLVPLLLQSWRLAAALALCLAGDVLLLPQVDRFRTGLAAFLLAHIAFIAALTAKPLQPSRGILAVPLLVLPVLVGPRLLRAVPGALRIPVIVYALALLGLVAVAEMTGGAIAPAGAGLFLVSDTLLAVGRFLGPAPGGRVGVMITYHLAIGLLTLSLAF